MIDAKDEEIEFISKTIKKHISDCEIRVFGSRIKGKARRYSDIDIAIITNGKIEWSILGKIGDEFAESEIPYRIDIIDWNAIDESFRKIIEEKYEIII